MQIKSYIFVFLYSSLSLAGTTYELSHQAVYPLVRSNGGEYTLSANAGSSGIFITSGDEYELVVEIESGQTIRQLDFAAFSDFASQWLSAESPSIADLNGDGFVDLSDLYLLAEEWLNLIPSDWYLR